MLSFGDTLVILRTDVKEDRSDSIYSGIYVFNVSSHEYSHAVQGEYWSIVNVSNVSGTFAALQANQVSFFELQEGQLVLISTTTLSTELFPRPFGDGRYVSR